MSFNIVVCDNEENFLQFLDPDLCTLVENNEEGGMRTLEFSYIFQDLVSDKDLFRIGNKIWVSGDENIDDCMYIINTPLVQDIYKENTYTCELEEKLVELNYLPPFTQIELTADNGFTFSTNSNNNEYSVVVNWQALNYWFGELFNIGVVQDCLNEYSQKIGISGSINRMSLLRLIEEETGNIFVTRYEKDCITNVIHPYLDFLNPINVSKNWQLNLEYDFLSDDSTVQIYDSNDNIVDDFKEDVFEIDDTVNFDDSIHNTNLNASNITFRITDGENLLNTEGKIYSDGDTPLAWSASDVDFEDETQSSVISLIKEGNNIGLVVNEKTWVVTEDNIGGTINTFEPLDFTVESENQRNNAIIPDDSYFEIYDTNAGKTLFRTLINCEIGHVHTEILDFGFNLENIEFETDESDTYTAISPILGGSENDSYSRTDMSDILSTWLDLEIEKGDVVPMIVEKVTVKAASLAAAITSMGTYSVSSNYFTRPYNPNDNIDSNTPANSTFEFLKGTAYWKAPFSKYAGDFYVETDSNYGTEYTSIQCRPDMRGERDNNYSRPKIGNVEISEEDVYAIFNRVCMKLKDKQTREFTIDVDVANLRRGEYNKYQLHDKVYLKIPDYEELVTARVSRTSKDAHDIAKNTIQLNNYSINTIKNIQQVTYFDATNVSFKYPNQKEYSARLCNADYNQSDEYSVQYPANKLVTFTLWKVDENNTTGKKNAYTKVTDANGYAKIILKMDPGDYKLEINFGGDEEYTETAITVDVNVSGTKEVLKVVTDKAATTNANTKAKTTAKTSTTKTKKVTTYYSKYGVSDDKKYLMAIGRPSASGELSKYGYKFYKVVFKRKCPFCGSTELYWNIFWAGSEKASWGTNPAVNRRKSGSAEGEITCKKCDADFSIFGKDKASNSRKNLTVYKKAVKSTKAEAYKLKKGKIAYGSKTVTVTEKKNTSTKSRTQKNNNISNYVKKQALSIVGNSEGLAAAKKITEWFHKNIKYDPYSDFHRKPDTVLKKKKGNCCDQARALLTLMDAAGCTEKLTLQYVHVSKSPKVGHVFCKITTKSTGTWRYVDTCVWRTKNPWGHYVHGYGSPPGTRSNYPTLPF